MKKFHEDRNKTKQLRLKLTTMFEETDRIRNPCSNSPAEFLRNIESEVVKERVAWFGCRMRASLAQIYSVGDDFFHKPNHDVALLLVILSGRWRSHSRKTMQAHLNFNEITEIMASLGMRQELLSSRLNELEEMNWIVRADSLTDIRIKLIIPTSVLIHRQLVNVASHHLIGVATQIDMAKHLSKHSWGVMGYDMDLWHWAMKTFATYEWGNNAQENTTQNNNNYELFA